MKSKKIQYIVRLPLYSTPQFFNLFEQKKKYKFQNNKIRKLSNVFLSNSGLLLNNGFIPLASAENLIGKEDHTFYLKHYKKVIEQYFVSKYGKSLNSIKLDDKRLYFSIHTPWFGYFSWVTTYLPRLLEFISTGIDAVLIYPEEWDDFSFVKETFSFFPTIKFKRIPKDHHIFIDNYLLIPCRRWTSHFHKSTLLGVRDFFESKHLTYSKIKVDNIYISREKAKRRKISNELEVLKIFDQYNVESIIMEEYSYVEQIYMIQNSKMIFGIHGAGLTNLNYMRTGGKVIEFTPILDDVNNFRYPFWRMASLLDLDYYCIFCSKMNLTKDEYDSNIEVPIEELSKILTMIFVQ